MSAITEAEQTASNRPYYDTSSHLECGATSIVMREPLTFLPPSLIYALTCQQEAYDERVV
jgi:hypothetical protein